MMQLLVDEALKSVFGKKRILEIFSHVFFFLQLIFKDVSREFDEFQVNTHLCKLRCWYS